MTSWLPTPLLRFPPFHSEAEVVAVELAHLVLVAHRDQPDPRVTQVLPDLRAMLVNVDLPVQKDHVAFRVPLDPLAVELEEPLSLDQKDLGVLLALLDQRGSRAFRVLLGLRGIMVFLAQPGQMVNQAPRVRMEPLVPLDRLDPKVLLDLLESVAPPVRMLLLLS